MLPGFSAKASQPEGPRPPAARLPSIWNAAEATPRVNPRAQARGEGLNCYSVLHSHAPIIHSTAIQDNGPPAADCTACAEGLIRFCPQIPAY